MNNKIQVLSRSVPISTYQTTDAKEFKKLEDAEVHQGILDGTKRQCDECKGRAGTYEDHGEWGYYEDWVKVECAKCQGRGYLELKWS